MARLARLLPTLCVAAALGACGLTTLRNDIREYRSYSVISGNVVGAVPSGAPVLALLLDADRDEIVDVDVLFETTEFRFVAVAGAYRVAAFVDLDSDRRHRPDYEPAAIRSKPVRTRTGATAVAGPLKLSVGEVDLSSLTQPAFTFGVRGDRGLPDSAIGKIVPLDDPMFFDDKGRRGLWEPMEFLDRVGAGIYFVEPFDPARTPVLFIHGQLGTPGNWKRFVEGIDTARYQPWLAYYPSALGVEEVAQSIVGWLYKLRVLHRYDQIALVGHSYGGLVAAAVADRLGGRNGAPIRPGPLVTFATPWDGHPLATLGVKRSPVVAPAWRDVAPGSRVLERLQRAELPESCPHHLVFAFGDGRAGGSATDGNVPVAYQLPMLVQQRAARVVGLDETHASILLSANAVSLLNLALCEHRGGCG